jgi:hypothetical protein
MKKELEKAIEKYEKSQTSLGSCGAIYDFVEGVLEQKEFIEQIEKER